MLLLLACTAPGGDTAFDSGWELVWSDPFDGAEGAAPDPTVWAPELGGEGWGNNQLEYNTDRPDNVALDGQGRLAITAREEDYEGNRYTSARLSTRGLWTHGYGRFEADIQVPAGRGLWPAFWMLGESYDTVGWPACGEIDVLELKGERPDTSYATVHGPGYSGAGGISSDLVLRDGSFADGFHTFAADVDPEHIAFWVDDTRVGVVRPGDLPDGTAWVFDGSWFMLLNLAVGGNFVEEPDETTPFPATLLVEEVRVYERAGGAP